MNYNPNHLGNQPLTSPFSIISGLEYTLSARVTLKASYGSVEGNQRTGGPPVVLFFAQPLSSFVL